MSSLKTSSFVGPFLQLEPLGTSDLMGVLSLLPTSTLTGMVEYAAQACTVEPLYNAEQRTAPI